MHCSIDKRGSPDRITEHPLDICRSIRARLYRFCPWDIQNPDAPL